MNENQINNHDKAEAFIDNLAKLHNLNHQKTSGKLAPLNENSEILINKRFFIYSNQTYNFYAYYYSEFPENKEHPFSFKGRLLKKKFEKIEEDFLEKSHKKLSWKNVQLNLGFPTPVDQQLQYQWGLIGCFQEHGPQSRKFCDQFQKDFEGSLKRLEKFDKNGRIPATLIKWNANRGFGILESELFKKVMVNIKDLNSNESDIKEGLSCSIRVLNSTQKPKAFDILIN